jgi:hypothetical protein
MRNFPVFLIVVGFSCLLFGVLCQETSQTGETPYSQHQEIHEEQSFTKLFDLVQTVAQGLKQSVSDAYNDGDLIQKAIAKGQDFADRVGDLGSAVYTDLKPHAKTFAEDASVKFADAKHKVSEILSEGYTILKPLAVTAVEATHEKVSSTFTQAKAYAEERFTDMTPLGKIATVIVGAGVGVVVPGVVLGTMGFSSAGIAAGSVGAKMMSVTPVLFNPFIAICQSSGAAGISFATKVMAATVGGCLGSALTESKKDTEKGSADTRSESSDTGMCRCSVGTNHIK